MKVQTVTHEVRLQNWRELVKECRMSGKTINAWCTEHNINPKTYYHWQRLVCRELSQLPMQTPGANQPAVFAELSVPQSHSGKIAVTIERRDFQIHIYCGADQATVETAFLALKSLC